MYIIHLPLPHVLYAYIFPHNILLQCTVHITSTHNPLCACMHITNSCPSTNHIPASFPAANPAQSLSSCLSPLYININPCLFPSLTSLHPQLEQSSTSQCNNILTFLEKHVNFHSFDYTIRFLFLALDFMYHRPMLY